MIDDRDDDLRHRFFELKARDRIGTPSFDAVMGSARAQLARPRTRIPLRAAAAVLLLIAGGAAAALLIHRAHQPRMVAIGSWQSPTDWLLRVSSPVPLDAVPSVTASVVQVGDPFAVNVTSRQAGRSKGDTL